MNELITAIIVDDEIATRNGLQQIIEKSDLNIKVIATANNGKDALSLIVDYKPHIAILDINMPEMDGLEVISRIHALHLPTRIFILSGYDNFSYAQEAIKYGVKSYFLKPLDIPEFINTLKQCIQEITQDFISSINHSSLITSSKFLFLNHLIEGQAGTDANILQQLTILGCPLTASGCYIVTYAFKQQSVAPPYLLEEMLNEYLIPTIADYTHESWVYKQQHIVSIFNVDIEDYDSFKQLLNEFSDKVTTLTGCELIIGIGPRIETLSEVPTSYVQALEALTYHIYDSYMKVFDSHIICHETPSFSKENIDFKPIIYFITKHHIQGIEQYCHHFIDSLFFTTMPQPNFIFGMCMYLMVNIQKQLLLLYPDKNLVLNFSFEDLVHYHSIADLTKQLVTFCIQYSDLIEDSITHLDTTIKIAEKYILDHLNTSLKTKDIAAQVNLSESYFAVYFKNKTGINLRDYILKTRIDYAKQLLRQRTKNISEIADLTGYTDYRSFSRAFKNETGMSPTEYIK